MGGHASRSLVLPLKTYAQLKDHASVTSPFHDAVLAVHLLACRFGQRLDGLETPKEGRAVEYVGLGQRCRWVAEEVPQVVGLNQTSLGKLG